MRTLVLTLAASLTGMVAPTAANAQSASASDAPAGVFAHLIGSWEGEGTLLGRPGAFSMVWSTAENGFVRLSFTNAWTSETGTTPVLTSEATYRPGADGTAVGVWIDSRPQRLTLDGEVTDSTLTTRWTAPSETGRTVYQVLPDGTVRVTDHVNSAQGERLFAEAIYRRKR